MKPSTHSQPAAATLSLYSSIDESSTVVAVAVDLARCMAHNSQVDLTAATTRLHPLSLKSVRLSLHRIRHRSTSSSLWQPSG